MQHAVYGDPASRDSIALVIALHAKGIEFEFVAETPALSLSLAVRAGRGGDGTRGVHSVDVAVPERDALSARDELPHELAAEAAGPAGDEPGSRGERALRSKGHHETDSAAAGEIATFTRRRQGLAIRGRSQR